MPYVFYDELPDGMEEADVVPRSELDALTAERDELVATRDELADHVSVLETDLRQSREKYAHAVLTSAERVKREQAHDVRRDSGPQTYEELFRAREGA